MWLFLLYTIKTKYPYRIKLQNTDKMWSSNRSHLHQPTLAVKRTRPPVDICFIWNFIIKKKKEISKHSKCQKPNRTWKLQLVCIIINLFQYFIWPNFCALSMLYSPIENLPPVETAQNVRLFCPYLHAVYTFDCFIKLMAHCSCFAWSDLPSLPPCNWLVNGRRTRYKMLLGFIP